MPFVWLRGSGHLCGLHGSRIADPIPYRITHFAKPEPIPKPREHEFWDTYVTPLLKSSPTGAPAAATSIIEERERLNRVHYPQRYKDAEPGCRSRRL